MERIYEDVFQDAFDLEDHCRILAVPRSKGSLHITVSEAGNKEIDLEVMESTQLRLFIHNKADGKVVLHMKGKIMAGASARIALLDLEDQPFEFDQHIDLKEEGASIDNSTAQLVKSAFKKGNIEIRHEKAHTSGHMHNFAVLFDHAKYEMVANGNILKGAFDSASHQETRVLTLGKDHETKVIPLLLIDENDVKASHALTIGEPDENQLYYLQSRGLSKETALGLLSVGYFMPVICQIENEDLREQLREEMERKVGIYGH